MTCWHGPWLEHMIRRRRAWYAIIALGKHTQSEYIWRGMTSSPLGSTCGLTTLGVAFHHYPSKHTRSDDVGVECYRHSWTTQVIRPRRA